jgi:hypothetical protein
MVEHTFAEGIAFLNDGHYIDYDVSIDRHHGALMTRETWLDHVQHAFFIDYDGMGSQISADGRLLANDKWIYPSTANSILPETAYILWYNR